MALVLLRCFSTPVEADIARGFLHSHGIRAFRFDPENYGHTVTAAGVPPRLMVAEEELEEASSLLAAIEDVR